MTEIAEAPAGITPRTMAYGMIPPGPTVQQANHVHPQRARPASGA